MNRKDRRAQEKAAEKAKPKNSINIAKHKIVSPLDIKAEEIKAQALAFKAMGNDTAAIPLFIEALKLNSGLADVHFQLAMMSRLKPELNIDLAEVNKNLKDKNKLKEAYQIILTILRERNQYSEALICQEELCRLYPDDLGELANLGVLFNMIGKTEHALKIFADLLEKSPNDTNYMALFMLCNTHVLFDSPQPLIKKALQSFFDDIYKISLTHAFPIWIEVARHDPECKGLKEAQLLSALGDFSGWIKNISPDNSPFLKSKFFLDGIRLLIIPNIELERLFVQLREWICLNINEINLRGEIEFFEGFVLALGEQCFFNEYIYSTSEAENLVVENIISDISPSTFTDKLDLFKLALVSCYQPLNQIFSNKQEIFEKLGNNFPIYKSLLKIQFFDPNTENMLKNNIESFGKLENSISKNVQEQYEENPYPRWISIARFASVVSDSPIPRKNRDLPLKILIAGCGTGRHALGTAANYPNGQITAIDLSRASLAYAQRKANESGLAGRVNFIHADILNMKDWVGEFDIIESSGVLHHMQDPFKGWQTLNSLLKRGGFFKIGLYSELARTQVVEARNYVEANGFSPTLRGIRACRDSILALPQSNPMRIRLEGTSDFYTTSLVRDLIFHVQEHRMTLPQIEQMLEKLGLKCCHFVFSNSEILRRYDASYPTDPKRNSMKNWHEFEQKNPDTFMGMYQFWCEKIS